MSMLPGNELDINDGSTKQRCLSRLSQNCPTKIQSLQTQHSSLVWSAKMLTPIVFTIGLVIGIAIGSATSISALTQGAPDILQSWAGVVAMP